jgi:hypothetical protein
LLTLLSAVLIAFTIEFDNESERQSVSAGTPKHFLVSLVFWSNYMRFVRKEGVSFGKLQTLAQVSSNALRSRLGALQRWGYVVVDQGGIVRPTAFGRRARSFGDRFRKPSKRVGRRASVAQRSTNFEGRSKRSSIGSASRYRTIFPSWAIICLPKSSHSNASHKAMFVHSTCRSCSQRCCWR